MQYKEEIVAKVHEIEEGALTRITVDDKPIILCKVNGKIHAIGGTCSHYGAPLEQGVLSGNRVVCPWHHAAFNVVTGKIEEPPALDAIPSYEVRVDGEDVIVRVPDQIAPMRMPVTAAPNPGSDSRIFVILGAGAAGTSAAQTLREDGFKGRIVMISQETDMPYDRPKLSKSFLAGQATEDDLPMRSSKFFQELGIELMFGRRVIEVDIKKKRVSFEGNDSLEYDAILLATGGKPRTLTVPGSNLGNIFTLRSRNDCEKIIEAAKKASQVAVIGASFIGVETAFSLKERGLSVSVIAPEEVPFERVFGREIGLMFRKRHEKNGVVFHLGTEIERFNGNTSVKSVVLKDGAEIKADIVLIGIGVTPATEYLKGIPMEKDGGIRVDGYFQAARDVFAAGDIAWFPYKEFGRARIEHWRTSMQQGRYAAHAMAGKSTTFQGVPFFWTRQAGLNIRYVGHAASWDDIIIHGDIADADFLAYYIKDGNVRAAAGNKNDQAMDAIEELMRLGQMPQVKELDSSSDKYDWIGRLDKLRMEEVT